MTQSALYEHRFWLQILGDHARFIMNTLSPAETQDVKTASAFIHAFDRLLEQAREATENSIPLSKQNLDMTLNFRMFKLDLLRRAILGKVAIGLTPTFINHMINELEEYVKIL